MAGKYYWLRERHNPQLGTYYVAHGKITLQEAREYAIPLYGTNKMHKFRTKEAYEAEIEMLKSQGKRVEYIW